MMSTDGLVRIGRLLIPTATLESLSEIARRERRTLVKLMVGSLVIGFVLAFGSGKEYVATTRILPYRSGLSGTAGLSGLAGLAGIRLPAGVADQTITADLYPEVARSLDFRIQVAETPIFFSDLDRTVTTVTYFRDARRLPLTELIAKYTIELPGEVLASFRSDPLRLPTGDASGADGDSLVSYDRSYLKLIRKLDRRLAVTFDKRTSIITITGRMPDPVGAANLVRTSSGLLMQSIIDYESRKAGEQFRFVDDQYQQAKSRYERAQRDLAVFTDRNRVITTALAQIDRDRLQREAEQTFEIYQQFGRELEQARIRMNQDTPVFTILERVSVPSERASPNRLLIVFVAAVIGLLLSLSRLGWSYFLATLQMRRGAADAP